MAMSSTTMNMPEGDCGGMPMMIMNFHFGHCETILFESWKITSVGGLIGSIIGIFLLSILYEGLKFFRDYLLFRYRKKTNASKMMCSWPHFLQTFLHIVQVGLSYCLMLVVMTYNVWLLFAVIFGAGVGYFLFGFWKRTDVDITEHCISIKLYKVNVKRNKHDYFQDRIRAYQ